MLHGARVTCFLSLPLSLSLGIFGEREILTSPLYLVGRGALTMPNHDPVRDLLLLLLRSRSDGDSEEKRKL